MMERNEEEQRKKQKLTDRNNLQDRLLSNPLELKSPDPLKMGTPEHSQDVQNEAKVFTWKKESGQLISASSGSKVLRLQMKHGVVFSPENQTTCKGARLEPHQTIPAGLRVREVGDWGHFVRREIRLSGMGSSGTINKCENWQQTFTDSIQGMEMVQTRPSSDGGHCNKLASMNESGTSCVDEKAEFERPQSLIELRRREHRGWGNTVNTEARLLPVCTSKSSGSLVNNSAQMISKLKMIQLRPWGKRAQRNVVASTNDSSSPEMDITFNDSPPACVDTELENQQQCLREVRRKECRGWGHVVTGDSNLSPVGSNRPSRNSSTRDNYLPKVNGLKMKQIKPWGKTENCGTVRSVNESTGPSVTTFNPIKSPNSRTPEDDLQVVVYKPSKTEDRRLECKFKWPAGEDQCRNLLHHQQPAETSCGGNSLARNEALATNAIAPINFQDGWHRGLIFPRFSYRDFPWTRVNPGINFFRLIPRPPFEAKYPRLCVRNFVCEPAGNQDWHERDWVSNWTKITDDNRDDYLPYSKTVFAVTSFEAFALLENRRSRESVITIIRRKMKKYESWLSISIDQPNYYNPWWRFVYIRGTRKTVFKTLLYIHQFLNMLYDGMTDDELVKSVPTRPPVRPAGYNMMLMRLHFDPDDYSLALSDGFYCSQCIMSDHVHGEKRHLDLIRGED